MTSTEDLYKNATPTPWREKRNKATGDHWIESTNVNCEDVVALFDETGWSPRDANAALIVHCVNNFQQMEAEMRSKRRDAFRWAEAARSREAQAKADREEIERLKATLLSCTESAARDRESLEGEARLLNEQLDAAQGDRGRLRAEVARLREGSGSCELCWDNHRNDCERNQ